MPVPVQSVSTTHSVQKCNKSGDPTNPQSSVLHLKCTFPLSSRTLLPSIATRQQRISSPPRRNKDSRAREKEPGPVTLAGAHRGFATGLAGAVDALAIKGANVQTCIPPLNTFLQSCGLEMQSRNSPPCDSRIHREQAHETSSGNFTIRFSRPELVQGVIDDVCMQPGVSDLYPEEDGGLFSPILEDDSPDMLNGDVGSSPIEPVTPFGDYVDRVVAASDATALLDSIVSSGSQELQLPVKCDSQFYSYPFVEVKGDLVSANEHLSSTSLIHRQLVDPMAEWLVTYLWKVCTNVLVLPQTIAPYTLPNAPQLRQPTPLYLTARVHSLLMSTLLQPSAMLLALWYIVRLPVYFGAPGLGPEHVKERRFRVELLSDTHDSIDGETIEATATFRLIVLGCMLANKWLDDHTFSNKTWHTISNIPVQLLNKLEYFALDILSYDLSVSSSAWSQWLNHLLSYHHSLNTTTRRHPQPIARPAPNPSGLIRRAIQEIMEAPLGHSMNEPVFLGVEQRLKEKLGLSSPQHEAETFDIDLDEDGPLREEYLPRRRVGNGFPTNHGSKLYSPAGASVDHILPFHGNLGLPPPAKWSPAGDEPICRPCDRSGSMYLPVQPSLASHYAGAVQAIYPPWPTGSLPYAAFRHDPEGGYPMNTLPISQYTYWASMNCACAVQRPWYSSGGFDYRYSDNHLVSDGAAYHGQPRLSWTPVHQYGYATTRQPPVPRPPPSNYPSTWIRA